VLILRSVRKSTQNEGFSRSRIRQGRGTQPGGGDTEDWGCSLPYTTIRRAGAEEGYRGTTDAKRGERVAIWDAPLQIQEGRSVARSGYVRTSLCSLKGWSRRSHHRSNESLSKPPGDRLPILPEDRHEKVKGGNDKQSASNEAGLRRRGGPLPCPMFHRSRERTEGRRSPELCRSGQANSDLLWTWGSGKTM